MTLNAINLGVLSFQDVAGFRVIKSLGIHLRTIVIPSMVIGVTLHTRLSGQSMKPFLRGNLGSNRFMAFITFFIGDPFSRGMTFQTICLLELSMTEHHRAGSQKLIKESLRLLRIRNHRRKPRKGNNREKREKPFFHRRLLGGAPSRRGAMSSEPKR